MERGIVTTPEAFRKFVEKTDTLALECRYGRKHRWYGITDVRHTQIVPTERQGVYQIETDCEFCGAHLVRLSRNGYIDDGVWPAIVYPPGYAAPPGSSNIDYRDRRAMVEIELIARRAEEMQVNVNVRRLRKR